MLIWGAFSRVTTPDVSEISSAVAVPPRTGEPEPGTICRQSSLRVTTGGICSAQPHRQVWWSPSARRIPNMESEGPGRFQVNELYYLENTWKYLADITIKHDCIQFLSSACVYIYMYVCYIYIYWFYIMKSQLIQALEPPASSSCPCDQGYSTLLWIHHKMKKTRPWLAERSGGKVIGDSRFIHIYNI